MYTEILLAFGSLLPIVNPISTAFVFNKLTSSYAKKERRKIARSASVTAFLVLLVFLFVGPWILSFFGITIYAFRIAGGIYLSLIAFQMLGRKLRKSPEHFEDDEQDIAIIPVAIPLLSGPGSITAVMVAAQSISWLPLVIAIFLVCVLSFLALYYAKFIDKILGRTGTKVFEKLLGLVVLVISVQYVLNGILDFIRIV